MPPPTYPVGGEIACPVLVPGGQVSVRTPHNCTMLPAVTLVKFDTQDKALAETAALLVLSKKLSAVFHQGEDA
jgi:hypothetical protein